MADRFTSLLFPATGIDQRIDVAEYGRPTAERSYVLHATNLRVEYGRWRTRWPIWQKSLSGEDAEEYVRLLTQGAIAFDPDKGSGEFDQEGGPARLMEAAGGRLWTLVPRGGDVMEAREAPGDAVGNADSLLVHLAQAESYTVVTDTAGQTIVHRWGDAARYSTGYLTGVRDAASVPHFANLSLYFDGRLWVSTNHSRVYASDHLHASDPRYATDLLRFTDQRYIASGQYFGTPVSAGGIRALVPAIDSGVNYSRSEFELQMHAPNGIWSVRGGVPRGQWIDTRMVTLRSAETGAIGPYQAFARDGGTVFRSRHGIQTVGLLGERRRRMGTPVLDLGEPMHRTLAGDAERLLRYGSMVNPVGWNRMYATAAPFRCPDSGQVLHRGLVVANWDQRNGPMWEGVTLLPVEGAAIAQVVSGSFDDEERVYVLSAGDGVKRVWELRRRDGRDVVDGEPTDICWRLLTKRLTVGGVWTGVEARHAALLFSDALTEVGYEVWMRTSSMPEPVKVGAGKLARRDTGGLKGREPSEGSVALGSVEEHGRNARWVQFLVVGQGTVSVDFAFTAGPGEGVSETPDTASLFDRTAVREWFDPLRL